MIRIAICGNIASGKTVVQKFLEQMGYKVFDTDEAAHRLLSVNNKPLYDAFKSYDVFENGEFSREKVGKLVFSNLNLKQKLESIIHPQIVDEIKKFYETNKSEAFLFVAIPLLFEAKMEFLFDKIAFVYADDEIRLSRLLKRNNFSLEYAKARINSQMPQDEKIKKSDYVINNNGDLNNLKIQVDKFLSGIIF